MKAKRIILAVLLFSFITAQSSNALAKFPGVFLAASLLFTDNTPPPVTPAPITPVPSATLTPPPADTPPPDGNTPPPAATQTQGSTGQPVTSTPYNGDPAGETPTPLPTGINGDDAQLGTPAQYENPDNMPEYRVFINVSDTLVQLNDTSFSLYSIPNAVDEHGMELPVTIYDDGGFTISALGTYVVVFQAVHPVTAEYFFESCLVIVEDNQQTQKSTLKGTSDSRYRKYLQYRNEVSATLKEHMERLNGQLEERLLLLSSAFSEAGNYELMRRVYLQTETDEEMNIDYIAPTALQGIQGKKISGWTQILAVFVAKNASITMDDPLDLFNLRKISFDTLDQVFWDMVEMRFDYTNDNLQLVLAERDAYDMADYYNFSKERRAQLDELMQPEFLRLFAALTGDESFSDLSEEDEKAIRESLPSGLNLQQENIVLTAHTLVGQVKYFWGGKYLETGWNPLWGVPKVVTSPDSPTTGTIRPFGLDCSGFVTWVFINAAKDKSVADAIGNGSSNQWHNSRQVGWDEAKPGDLAFKAVPGSTPTNHVGIVVEKQDDGTIFVAHCSSSKNNVVITEAWSSSFRYIRRPVLYG